MVHYCGSCASVNVLVFNVGLCGLGLRGNCCFKTGHSGDNVWTCHMLETSLFCQNHMVTTYGRIICKEQLFFSHNPMSSNGFTLSSGFTRMCCTSKPRGIHLRFEKLRRYTSSVLKKVCMYIHVYTLYNCKKKLITMARHSLEDNLMVKMHNLKSQLTNCTKSAWDMEDLCHQFCKIIPKDFQHIRALVTHHL